MKAPKISLIILLCLAMVPGAALGEWTDNSGNLPGIEHNVAPKLIGLGCGVVGAVLVARYLHHRQIKNITKGPVDVPTSLAFKDGEPQVLWIKNRGTQTLNLSEINLGPGFGLSHPPVFPQLLRPGQRLDLSVSRQSPFSKKSRAFVVFVDPGGKTMNRLVELRAAR